MQGISAAVLRTAAGYAFTQILSGDGTDARERCEGQNPPAPFDDCVAVLGDTVKNG